MLVEPVAEHGLHAGITPVVAGEVHIIKITAHSYRQFVVYRHGIHQCNVLLKAYAMRRTLAELCENRGSELHVQPLVQPPTVPSSESQRVVSDGLRLSVLIDGRQIQRVGMGFFPYVFA